MVFAAIHSCEVLNEVEKAEIQYRADRPKHIRQHLDVLENKLKSPNDKAQAFVRLLEEGYVMSCRLVGDGDDYDDEIHYRKFCETLKTPGYVEALMNVEARAL